jgi:hypothetical protein
MLRKSGEVNEMERDDPDWFDKDGAIVFSRND